MCGSTLFHGTLLGSDMSNEPVSPLPPGDAGQTPHGPGNGFSSGAPTQASYADLIARLARADLRLCEMQANMDELIDANCRLRSELGEMTLQWIIEKTKD